MLIMRAFIDLLMLLSCLTNCSVFYSHTSATGYIEKGICLLASVKYSTSSVYGQQRDGDNSCW